VERAQRVTPREEQVRVPACLPVGRGEGEARVVEDEERARRVVRRLLADDVAEAVCRGQVDGREDCNLRRVTRRARASRRLNGSVLVAEPPAAVRWYHRPFWLSVYDLMLGPLGLPYLWNSPRFSRGMKIVLTVAVIAYTGWLVVETIRIVRGVEEGLDVLLGQ
jgi:hypothetical protein